MINNIKIEKILFSTTFGVMILWGISGFSKLYLFNHYGISLKLLNFDILESFVPVISTIIEMIIILIAPLYLNYKVFKKSKGLRISIYVSISIIWGILFSLIYIIPKYFLYYDGEIDKTFGLIGLILLISPIFIYLSVLNFSKVFLLKENEFRLNILNSSSVIVTMFSIYVFAFIFFNTLLVGVKDYGMIDIVEKDNNEYFLLNKSEIGLIVTEFDFDENKNECYIQYGNYMIISPENTKFSKEDLGKIIIKKEK